MLSKASNRGSVLTEQQLRNVLLLVGENDGADFVTHGLAHPLVALHTANEETMANSLAHGPYDLAVVGGYVGSRGPLILCEAVRVQQRIPILILIGHETTEKVLIQHQSRKLEDVTYLDFRGWRDPTGSVVVVGSALRETALEILNLADDSAYGEQWQHSLGLAQEQRNAVLEAQRRTDAERAEAERAEADRAETERAEAEQAAAEEQEAEESSREKQREKYRDEVAPPFRAKLTDEDLEFVDRMIERTKNVDFRVKLTKTAAPNHADAATQKLRDNIRELERDRARLAFIYRSRRMDFEAYDDAVQRLEATEQNLQSIREESERRVRQIRDEAAQATEAMQQSFNASLGQTQQMFNLIQEQSATTLDQLREQVHAREEDVEALREEHAAQLANRQKDLERLRTQNQEIEGKLEAAAQRQKQAAAEREALINKYAERERAAVDANAARERELRQERDNVARARSDSEARAGTLNATLNAARGEIERLQAVEAQQRATTQAMQAQAEQFKTVLDEEAQQYQQQLAAAEKSKGQQIEQLEAAFAEERERYLQQLAATQQSQQTEMQNLQSAAAAERRELETGFAAERHELHEQLAAAHQATLAETTRLNDRIAALQDEHGRELVAAEEKLSREMERLYDSSAQERQQLRDERRAVEEELRQESERIRAAADDEQKQLRQQLAAQAEEHAGKLAAVEKEWSQKAEKLKQAAGTFSDAYKDRDSAAEEQQAKTDALEQRLADKDREIERLTRAQPPGADEEALERLARRFERGLEKVRSEITKQEALLVTASIPRHEDASEAAETDQARPPSEPAAADRTTPAGNDAIHPLARAWSWTRAQPERLIGAGALGSALLVSILLCIVFAIASPDSAPVPVGAIGQTAPEPRGDDAPAAGEAEEADAPGDEPTQIANAPEAVEEAAATAPREEAEAPGLEAVPAGLAVADGEKTGGASDLTPGSPESEEARKVLRREMIAAFKKKSWTEAVALGQRLREEFRLDWEAEYKLAEALEYLGRHAESVSCFEAFIADNPENAFVDDAHLQAGAIFAKQGNKQKARPHLEKAAQSKQKKIANAAKTFLKKL